jgi:hypothetical protein
MSKPCSGPGMTSPSEVRRNRVKRANYSIFLGVVWIVRLLYQARRGVVLCGPTEEGLDGIASAPSGLIHACFQSRKDINRGKSGDRRHHIRSEVYIDRGRSQDPPHHIRSEVYLNRGTSGDRPHPYSFRSLYK